jgi:hypothetical protein
MPTTWKKLAFTDQLHDVVTFGEHVDNVLQLTGQAISIPAVDKHKFLVGPTADPAHAPSFRTLEITDIANDLLTYAKLQNVSATDKILGRSTAGAGDVEEIACTAAGRALLDDANAAAQLATLGAAASGHDHTGTYDPAGTGHSEAEAERTRHCENCDESIMYPALSTDGTLAGNSDLVQVSQKAIKTYADRSATTSAPGVVELATDAEAVAGTDTARAVTPVNVQAKAGDERTRTTTESFEIIVYT